MALSMKAGAVARPSVGCRAAAKSWAPGYARPAHLTGTLPGDYGFDPLALGAEAKALQWYVQAELVHGRLAMTAAAGIVLPGLATKLGVLSVPEWYNAGEVYNASEGAIPFSTLLMIQLFMTNFVEVKRWRDFQNPKSQGEAGTFFGLESSLAGMETSYPGGAFDPLGMAKSPEVLADMKVKEVKNGRLAMMAMLGFFAQYKATGKGPIDNLFDHVANPWGTTFADNGVSLPFV